MKILLLTTENNPAIKINFAVCGSLIVSAEAALSINEVVLWNPYQVDLETFLKSIIQQPKGE